MTLADLHGSATVLERAVPFHGRVWNVVAETFELPGAGILTREFVDHPGAVAVLALDDADRVLLVRQYRHPIGTHEWELPAGLLDVPGEPELATAQRELFEEADMRAGRWHRLLGMHTSPGGMSEHITVFLARELTPVPARDRHERTAEEATMLIRWAPLDEVVAAVLSGDVENATLALGCLAAARARDAGWAPLGPVLAAR